MKSYSTWPLSESFSFGKLVVEAYKKEGLKTQERNGFAFIEQKLGLKGLKVLVSACIGPANGANHIVPKGSVAYIREEQLHTQAWAQKTLECESIEGKFLVVDPTFVEFIEPPKDE